MATITIALSDDQYQKLEAHAALEERSAQGQAKVFVLEALGLWGKTVTSRASRRSRARTPKPIASEAEMYAAEHKNNLPVS